MEGRPSELAQRPAHGWLETPPARFAVDRVAGQRVPDRLAVDPDLVGPAGQYPQLEQRDAARGRQHAVAADRRTSAPGPAHDGHAGAHGAVASDRQFDPPFGRFRPAVDHGQVRLADLPFGEGAAQAAILPVAARHGQDAARAGIQAMHDAGSFRRPDAGDPGPVVEEPVDQSAALDAAAGVHDQARGLVHDEQVLVLVNHRQGAGLGERTVRRRRRQPPCDLLASPKEVRGLERGATDRDQAAAEQLPDPVAGLVQDPRQVDVDPLARRRGRRPDPAGALVRAPRAAPCASRRAHGRHRFHFGVPARARPLRVGPASLARLRKEGTKLWASIRTMPTVTPLSATLKAGQ